MLEKLKKFYTDNKKVVLIGLGVVAVIVLWKKMQR